METVLSVAGSIALLIILITVVIGVVIAGICLMLWCILETKAYLDKKHGKKKITMEDL